MVKIRILPVLLFMLILGQFVAATFPATSPGIKNVVCSVINAVGYAIQSIGPALVAIMFVYGGIKYVFSADDPGGRKQGKMICIHAIIGGILISLLSAIMTILSMSAYTC